MSVVSQDADRCRQCRCGSELHLANETHFRGTRLVIPLEDTIGPNVEATLDSVPIVRFSWIQIPVSVWQCAVVRFPDKSRVFVGDVMTLAANPDVVAAMFVNQTVLQFISCMQCTRNSSGDEIANVNIWVARGARAPPRAEKIFSEPYLQGKVVSAPPPRQRVHCIAHCRLCVGLCLILCYLVLWPQELNYSSSFSSY